MYIKITGKIVLLLVFLSLMFGGAFHTVAQNEDPKSSSGDTTEVIDGEADSTGQKILDAAAQAELEGMRKEAEEARVAAEAAKAEQASVELEEKALQKAIEIEKAKLELEIKETEISRKESDDTKQTSSDRAEVKIALNHTKREIKEDKEAQERITLAEEKMLIIQEKSRLAEEEMNLARERMALAEERLRIKEGRPDIAARLIGSVIALAFGLLLLFLLKFGVKKLEKSLTKQDVIRESAITLQIKTMAKLFNWLGTIVIVAIVVYIILEKHGLDMAPLLAGAGIMGLAFGFGGQYLIRDLINGLFILVEGQFRVNDVVKIGEYGGLVEDINLRITTLRDLGGRVIIVPNGEIKTVVNYTRGYAQALLDIGVAYKENVDRVMDLIKEMGKELRQDPYFKRLIIGNLEMLGVDDFSDSAVIIKFRIKTLPIKQWEVMREFRRRLKNKFDEVGIEIPFPHRTMYWGTGKDNDWMKGLADSFKK